MKKMIDLPSIDFFGLKISIFTKQQLNEFINETIITKSLKICYGYSLGYIAALGQLKEVYKSVNKYDLMVTDGRHFYLLAKLMGAPLQYDISIPFFSKLCFQLANKNGYSIMIIGSSEERNKLASEKLQKQYPGAIVYNGYSGGSFEEKDDAETIRRINEVKPNMLFIGVSSPKKELFVDRCRTSLDVNIIIPFGGMIDGLAGKVKLTPPLLKKMGLATLVRTVQEPRRLFLLNIRETYQIIFRIIPATIYNVKFLKNQSFFIPGLYEIDKDD